MGNHSGGGVHTGALEQMSLSIDIVQQVTDDFWVVAGACAGDDTSMEALGTVTSYLATLLEEPEGLGDPELVALGIRNWLDEMRSQGMPADPAVEAAREASRKRHPSHPRRRSTD